jgi:hypothetical protein
MYAAKAAPYRCRVIPSGAKGFALVLRFVSGHERGTHAVRGSRAETRPPILSEIKYAARPHSTLVQNKFSR